jgi:chitin-binding protein
VVAGLAAVGLLALGLVTGVLIGGAGSPAATAGKPSAPTRGVPAPVPAHPAAGCVADYAVVNAWQGGYQAQVTVSNPGHDTLAGWSVTLDLPGGQTITQVWNGRLSERGTSATIANLSYNAEMSADASTTFGFLGSVSGSGTADTPMIRCTAR